MSKIVLPAEPTRDEISFVAVMHALSDPTRLSIVMETLKEGEMVCGSFVSQAPKSTLSHHFRVLRESGVLATRRQGKELVNTVRSEDLNTLFPGLLEAVMRGARSKEVRSQVEGKPANEFAARGRKRQVSADADTT